MLKITRPMKAPTNPITDAQLYQIEYPVVGSPKIDGIRAVCDGEQVLSNTFKKIGNRYIQKCLSKPEYAGLDGELAVGLPYIDPEDDEDDVFHRTSGPVRRGDGEPDFKLYVFDDVSDPLQTYQYRWIDQIEYEESDLHTLPFVVVIEQVLLYTPEEVIAYEEKCCNLGYEGAMIRRLSAPYKSGRSTLREEFIFKRKPIEIDDAVIVGCYEQLENLNEKTETEFGTSKRSSHKANKFPKGTLGGFELESAMWKVTFRCGTIIGSTLASRKEMWDNRDKMIGQVVSYKFQRIGSIDKPRQPRIKGFRNIEDMSDD